MSDSWSLIVEGEADDTFLAMLGCIEKGWIIEVITDDAPGFTARWRGTAGRAIIVQPISLVGGVFVADGPERTIDLSDLVSVHLF